MKNKRSLLLLGLLLAWTYLFLGSVQAGGPGRYDVPLVTRGSLLEVGTVSMWNSPKKLIVQVTANDGVLLKELHLFAGEDIALLPATSKGNPKPGKFPWKFEVGEGQGVKTHTFAIDLKDDLNFSWGKSNRVRYAAVHAELASEAGYYDPLCFDDCEAVCLPTCVEGDQACVANCDLSCQVSCEDNVLNSDDLGAWNHGPYALNDKGNSWYVAYELAHPQRGQFIDSPVQGLSYQGPTQQGNTGPDAENENGGFLFYPDENILFSIGSVELGVAPAAKKVSPLDLFVGGDTDDPRVIGVARVLQSLDANQSDGKITLLPEVVGCFEGVVSFMGLSAIDYGDAALIDALVNQAVATCNGAGGAELLVVAAAAAQGNLEKGLNASGIFRKNMSKTEDWAETKQKIDIVQVYIPGIRSDGTPSLCCIDDPATPDDECDPANAMCDDPLTPDVVELCGDPGIPYEEWRLGGDPAAEECDPRDDSNGNGIPDGDEENVCVITQLECRDVAKPLVVNYMGMIDIYDDQVTTAFWPHRFSYDVYSAISRDDGTTWKRMNVSRMGDLSSFDLETEEPFPGTVNQPYLKVDDNYILNVWESKYCKSGNPRYSITTCDDPATEEVEVNNSAHCTGLAEPDPCCIGVGTGTCGCAVYCRGNAEQGTEVCEPDYPYDDDYYVSDIWGVRGQQQSVDYNEVDDVADLGIGEIPYSCLWTARGVIVTQKELDAGTFNSLNVVDDPETPDVDETRTVVLGDIVWFKPERITSGRRDAYIPMVESARGAGFAIVWQEDPDGLRPGKGKGPGEGWSGAISNHKSDMWYTFIKNDDFAVVDENFVSGGPGGGSDGEPSGGGSYDEKSGLGRPKALVPFAMPVRVSDNDMVNTDTLKVALGSNCVTPPNGTTPVCFPEVVDGSFVPLIPDDVSGIFCDDPDADPNACCDRDDVSNDPDCVDVKGLQGNLTGTKRYAYLAKMIDERDNATGLYVPGGDGVPDYQYYVDRGGTLDLCDTTGTNSYMDLLPGTAAHERWFGFTNVAGASKLACVTSDGRLLDGDVSASRPMIKLQPYTKPDGSKSAWALLAYEESKGMGHSLAASEHETTDPSDNPVDDIIQAKPEEPGQDKPIKQDLGKNMIYHSFDFTQPDLVSPGHIVNLPALCGGLYPVYCGEDYLGDNPTCTCTPGQPVPLYFDYLTCADPNDPATCEWMPDATKLLQYRTEIARRARFIVQSPSKVGASKTLGALIYKQGQEGQGRPADVFIRRFVRPAGDTGNPYKFENMECTTYLDQTFALPGCPTDGVQGYMCNVWGEASGDRLCGGTFTDPNGGYPRRDHINLTSHTIDLAVDAGPDDDTPEDPTDDLYGTNKVLLWSQTPANLGDESYGLVKEDGTGCDFLGNVTGTPEQCPGMYSNARSHRGFIRGDLLVTAFSLSPNWAAGRNGNDRYNFYVRRSFDGGATWTTTPAGLGGLGINYCREWRSDPNNPDPDGSGNLPPVPPEGIAFDSECVEWCPPPCVDDPNTPEDECFCEDDPLTPRNECNCEEFLGEAIAAGAFEPARNISQIANNKESSGDPRLGATPPTYPLDGTQGQPTNLCPKMGAAGTWECIFPEDEYVDNFFFVAWGTVDNAKSTGSTGVKAEAGPLDIYYTRTADYGDTYLKIPWNVNPQGNSQNWEQNQLVYRYDYLAKGEPEEQGECQLRGTPDGSKMYAIYHSVISAEEDPTVPYTRWYPWKPSESFENDLWFRRVIFWPQTTEPPAP